MSFVDKRAVLERVRQGERVSVELGCGPRKLDPHAVGIDMLDYEGVDLVGDAFEILTQFPEGSVHSLYTSHFLEHITEPQRMLMEIARVVAPGGIASIIVPHFSNPFYHSDPTHRTPFGLYTLAYFCKQNLFSRGVPNYGLAVPLEIASVSLGFKSYPPRYVRHAIKRAIGLLVNATMYTREFYEENLCWLIPCYEIRYELRKR